MPIVLNNVHNPSSGLEWNERGDAICVRHPEEFAKNTLPLHFKHSNFASFVRQLHMYGFSKSPPQPSSAHLHEFRHRHLLRDDLSLARLVRRKVNAIAAIAPPMSELQLLSQQVRLRHSRTVAMRTFWFDFFFCLVQVQGLAERQAGMELRLQQDAERQAGMELRLHQDQQQNAMLWQEMVATRRRNEELNAMLWRRNEELTSKINQMFSMFQRFANSFTNARPSKIVSHSGQQLIECQDDAGDADADLSTPQKRAR